MLDPESVTGTPVLVAATAGTARLLVLDHALRPLFSYLWATIVPTGVFAATEDFGSTAAGPLDERIERATREPGHPGRGWRRERRARSTATTGSKPAVRGACSAAPDAGSASVLVGAAGSRGLPS